MWDHNIQYIYRERSYQHTLGFTQIGNRGAKLERGGGGGREKRERGREGKEDWGTRGGGEEKGERRERR